MPHLLSSKHISASRYEYVRRTFVRSISTVHLFGFALADVSYPFSTPSSARDRLRKKLYFLSNLYLHMPSRVPTVGISFFELWRNEAQVLTFPSLRVSKLFTQTIVSNFIPKLRTEKIIEFFHSRPKINWNRYPTRRHSTKHHSSSQISYNVQRIHLVTQNPTQKNTLKLVTERWFPLLKHSTRIKFSKNEPRCFVVFNKNYSSE